MKVNSYNIGSMISVDAAKVQPGLRSTRRMRKCAGWWEMRLARQGDEKVGDRRRNRKLEKQKELRTGGFCFDFMLGVHFVCFLFDSNNSFYPVQ